MPQLLSQNDTQDLKKLLTEGQENLTVINGLSSSMRDSSVFSRTLDSQVQALIHHAKECQEYLKEIDNILQKYYDKL